MKYVLISASRLYTYPSKEEKEVMNMKKLKVQNLSTEAKRISKAVETAILSLLEKAV